MGKNNDYSINKNIEKIKRGEYTNFLDSREVREINKRVNINNYNIFYCYEDCDKVIIYSNIVPVVRLIKIDAYEELNHSSIMGSLFGLNISSDTFGDIVNYNGEFYFYVIDSIYEMVMRELYCIGNRNVKLKEMNIDYLSNYKRQYDTIEIIVTSLRIDVVIARLMYTSRKIINEKILDKEIILNYDILTRNSSILKEGDIFSIRKFGKYKYEGIIKNTKKDNYIIKILKYM